MLEGNVLVLNRVFQAIQVTSVKRAFTLFVKGHVKAVDTDYRTYEFEEWVDVPAQPDSEFVNTPKMKIQIPRVVQLLHYDKMPRQEMKFSRSNIYLRDGNRCQYCGKKFQLSELSLDHVVPVSRGGRSTWDNVVCACLPCNVKKGHKLLSECNMTLRTKPVRPRWSPVHRCKGGVLPDQWKTFLDEAYWNVELKS